MHLSSRCSVSEIRNASLLAVRRVGSKDADGYARLPDDSDKGGPERVYCSTMMEWTKPKYLTTMMIEVCKYSITGAFLIGEQGVINRQFVHPAIPCAIITSKHHVSPLRATTHWVDLT